MDMAGWTLNKSEVKAVYQSKKKNVQTVSKKWKFLL